MPRHSSLGAFLIALALGFAAGVGVAQEAASPPDPDGAATPAAAAEPATASPEAAANVEELEWSETVLEQTPALGLEGNVGDGARAWEVCSHCHLSSGAGRPDGSVPQLAGQHTSVLIKQMADIREGRRENPIMYPFARTLTDPQKLADLAAYIETLPIPRENGKGPGTRLALGERLYARDCIGCHGDEGQGNAQELIPVVAGQHYEYLLRQVEDVADGWRSNNHPAMTRAMSDYTPEQLSAVVDYMSRLEWPERQQQN
jgi:cytochrome c553